MSDRLHYRFHTTTNDAWDAMLSACDAAALSIDLEEFIVEPNDIGARFTDMLEKKAREGVAVRLLLDWWGCKDFRHSSLHQRLEAAGVELRYFRPFCWRWLLNPARMFPRDHRKLLLIDGRKSFVGGVCIYDDITHWRDTMVEMDGDITDQLMHIFDAMWKRSIGKKIEAVHPDFETDHAFTIYANAPDLNESHFTDCLIDKMDAATDNIRLASPYFTPGKRLMPALMRALERGVNVQIMLSNYSKYMPYVVGKRLNGTLIRNGARIYYYEPIMLHLKMMMIDDDWSAIGSCNLDGLSMLNNQEVMLVSDDKAFTRQLNEHYEQDLNECLRFSYVNWQARPITQKCMGALLSPFRAYL